MLLEHYRGSSAREIAEFVERAVADGTLRPEEQLPTVRALATQLALSAATVASAYRELARRGVVHADGRRGTRVRPRPPLAAPAPPRAPAGVTDLSMGLPDPALLPPLARSVAAAASQKTAGASLRRGNNPGLLDYAREAFGADGIKIGDMGIVGGALDGIERVLGAHLRGGDAVAVEDPGFPPLLDLLAALGLQTRPVALDRHGIRPESLARALRPEVRALIVIPRAQNPTGAALDGQRAAALQDVLATRPDVLLIEDDHAGPVAGAPAATLAPGREHWAIIRSVSKWLTPDLRLAFLAADPWTLTRVEGRQMLGTGWISGILQATALAACTDPRLPAVIRHARECYTERRTALLDALATHGIDVQSLSGLNVWVPVTDEHAATRALLDAGYQASPGARFRLASAPGIRITIAPMNPADALPVAATIAASQTAARVHTY